MNKPSARLHSGSRVKDRGELFILNPKDATGFQRGIERIGSNGRNSLTLIPHDIARQDALVTQVETQANIKVSARENGANSRHSASRGRVDPHDTS